MIGSRANRRQTVSMREQSSISQDVWQDWILEAVRKIRSQKQRPSEERIFGAIRQHHQFSNEEILAQIDKCVTQGIILRVINKGRNSYKDPARVTARKLTISSDLDLTKAIIKGVREMKHENGSSLKEIEKYLTESRVMKFDTEVDFPTYLKSTVKVAAARGLLIQEGKLYKVPMRKESDRHGRRRKEDKSDITPKVSTSLFPLLICII